MGLGTRFKSKIRTKILVSLLLLSLISLVLFGYIVFDGMKELGRYSLKSSTSLGEQAVDDSIQALEEQAEKNLLKLVKDQAALSNALLERVEGEVNVVSEFASNLWQKKLTAKSTFSYSQQDKPEDIFAVSVYTLAPNVDINTVKEEVALSSGMDFIFISLLSNNPNIDTICLGTESGMFRSYPWRLGRESSYDPRKRSWYKDAAKTGKAIWTRPYIHVATKELIITRACPFYDAEHKLIGVVEIDVTLSVMHNRIISTQVGKSGYALLLDGEGDIIVRPGLNPGDTKWDESYATENLLESKNPQIINIAKDMIAGKAGIRTCELDEGKKYVAYAPISITNWSLGIIMPVKEIVAPAMATRNEITAVAETTSRDINNMIKVTRNTVIGIFIVIIIVVFFTAYSISKRITRPILALDHGAKMIGEGNLDYKLDIETGDEIEALAGAFNKMTSDLKAYVQKLTETTAAKERMEKELKIAHEIQMDIVPKEFPPFPDRPEFDLYAVLSPAREVGGDFYDFFMLDDDHLFFLVGDVSGKGVPAALFMAVTITLIKTIARSLKDPAKTLDMLNKEIARDNNSSMFISIFCGLMNVKTGEVSYASGGHNPPVIIRKNGQPEFIKNPEGTFVGMLENITYGEEKIVLQPEDTIYMYTDGVTEAFNAKQEQFSEDRLKEEIAKHRQESIKELVLNTLNSVRSFASGVSQSDDITVMALRYFHKIRNPDT